MRTKITNMEVVISDLDRISDKILVTFQIIDKSESDIVYKKLVRHQYKGYKRSLETSLNSLDIGTFFSKKIRCLLTYSLEKEKFELLLFFDNNDAMVYLNERLKKLVENKLEALQTSEIRDEVDRELYSLNKTSNELSRYNDDF